ncbi:hypothetical protein BD310DRAFT_906268 [Dichomitus squalens]|uniref:DUF6533 domain-containing protein n=1 Tax=Dichomitus squalens TaxID=114155 RepID=A0A4Q9PWU6_9APHY|nr:hypothetical protein BD310DRAFT_906268 [Dichomitus squalens]
MSLSNEALSVAILETNVVMNFIIVATATLVGYDYLTTFQQELALFWRSRPTLSSILFFFNRYLAIVYYIGMAPIRFFPSVTAEYDYVISLLALANARTYNSCTVAHYFEDILRNLGYLPFAIIVKRELFRPNVIVATPNI